MRQFTVYWPIAVELHRPATHKEDSVRCLGMCEWLVVLLHEGSNSPLLDKKTFLRHQNEVSTPKEVFYDLLRIDLVRNGFFHQAVRNYIYDVVLCLDVPLQ